MMLLHDQMAGMPLPEPSPQQHKPHQSLTTFVFVDNMVA
jgi:hypothetical protein